MRLSNNTVLITGGSSGIGLAMAEAFLEHGCTVAICARHWDRLREAKAAHPELLIQSCDLASERSRLSLAEWARVALPGLNVLINNAGVQRDIDFTEGLDEFLAGDNEMRVNLEAPIMLTGLLITQLRANSPSAVVNVSSGLAFAPAPRVPVYSASKAGVHAWSMAIRAQLEPVGVKVFEVVPPAVDTNLNPDGRASRPGFKAGVGAGEFVAAVMQGLEADAREIGYGTTAGLLHGSRVELDRAERISAGWR